MMSCKFKCVGINMTGEKVSVSFQPIKDAALGENAPCGSVNLVLVPETAVQFSVGKDYSLDFKEDASQP